MSDDHNLYGEAQRLNEWLAASYGLPHIRYTVGNQMGPTFRPPESWPQRGEVDTVIAQFERQMRERK